MIIILLAFCYCFSLKKSLTLTSALHSIYLFLIYCFKIYCTGVNFINILRVRFLYESALHRFSLFTFWLQNFLTKGYWWKISPKMSMKLTTGFPRYSQRTCSRFQQPRIKNPLITRVFCTFILCISYLWKVKSTLNFRLSLLQLVLLVGY